MQKNRSGWFSDNREDERVIGHSEFSHQVRDATIKIDPTNHLKSNLQISEYTHHIHISEYTNPSRRLFGPSRVVVSFNGGKDAVVVLHLFRLALAGFYDQHEGKVQMMIKF